MTQRFFYTDPLAAAWMAKHFGMMFGIEHNGELHWNCVGRLDEAFGPLQEPQDILDPISELRRLYVHPESLQLLTPLIGDLVQYTHLAAALIVSNEDYVRKHPRFINCYKAISDALEMDDPRIIQRDGIAFIWPESEDANE